MEKTYYYENAEVKIIDNSNVNEKRERLEQAIITFYKEKEKQNGKTINRENRKRNS